MILFPDSKERAGQHAGMRLCASRAGTSTSCGRFGPLTGGLLPPRLQQHVRRPRRMTETEGTKRISTLCMNKLPKEVKSPSFIIKPGPDQNTLSPRYFCFKHEERTDLPMNSTSKLRYARASRNRPNGPDKVKEHLLEGTREELTLRPTQVHILRASMPVHLLRREDSCCDHEVHQQLQEGDAAM